MTVKRTIEMARLHLITGNRPAYARVMSGAIRAAMSNKAANALRAAIAEDGAEDAFVGLSTTCPAARG